MLKIGDLLLFEEKPEKVDVIVLLRGGLLDRTLQTAELYKKGFGNKILIPMALSDNVSKDFKKYNVILPTEQKQIKSILQQLNIPEENIILSHCRPGGGTVGEANRVKKDLLELGVNKFIVVSTWYHTRRVYNIYNEIFKNTDIKFRVIASKYGKSNSRNWWRFRYITRAVIFEFPRSCISRFIPTYNLTFHDDPEQVK